MEKVIFIQILDRPLLNCPTLEEAPTSGIYATHAFLAVS